MIQKETNIELCREIFDDYKENYNPIINEFTKIYTYSVEEKIVGFVIFNVIYEKCEIIDIFVKEEYRNNSIAQNLIKEILKDFDVENITLEVSKNNKPAINLYEKLGFKAVATRKNYYSDADGLLMLKEVR